MRLGAPGTAISVAQSRGASVQPSRRAACAGKSAVRSGVAVKIALTMFAGTIRLRAMSSVISRDVAMRIDAASFFGTEIAPRTAAMVVGWARLPPTPGATRPRSARGGRRLRLVEPFEVLADHA